MSPMQKRATFLSPSKQSPRVEIDVNLPSVKEEMMQEYETMALKSYTLKLKEAEITFYPPKSPSTKRLHSHPGTRSRVAASSTSSEGSFSEPSSSSDVLAAGSKSFGCGDCGKTFATKQGLSIHFKKDTKETPFEGDVCGKHYSKKACLTKHIMTHFNESTRAN
ncbi:zinc finger protein 248-like [Dreissena polymorpha]|uniref:C2H2-type domain-containing protein n=1 Tax=Dreissena polymorpha TaxID=45954 RepID=A0A9D4G892_DREPO|nr:zinc finger protein 248-like [Dreissena polymorpha]KAH3812349.1 hypothetical protein DPMN_140779 [Dreissena polymorpha]